MESLVKVDAETIEKCLEHYKKCAARGKAVIQRLKTEKVEVKQFFGLYKKTMTKMDSAIKSANFYPVWYVARILDYIDMEESKCYRLYKQGRPNFTSFTKHGTMFLLCESDYNKLHEIMETQFE